MTAAVTQSPASSGVRCDPIDAGLAPGALMTLEDRLLSTSLARPRLYAALVGSFAFVALAVTGVDFSVSCRTRSRNGRASWRSAPRSARGGATSSRSCCGKAWAWR